MNAKSHIHVGPRPKIAGGVPSSFEEHFDSADPVNCDWLRLPRPKSRCPITGLSRTTLEELVRDRRLPAKKLRRPGGLRGITLINREALLRFVSELPDAQ